MPENKVCEIYKKCSGCQLMNLSYPEQLKLKQSEIIKLYGKFCHVETIIGMDNPYHYRNKATRAFKLRYPNMRIISGIYQSKTGGVVPCDCCLLEDIKSQEMIRDIKKLMPKYKLLPFDEGTGKGLIRHITVRKAAKTGEYMVVIVTSSPVFPKGKELAAELCGMHPEVKTVVQNISRATDKMVLGDQEKVLLGEGRIIDELMGLKFLISASSFYQVNPIQTEKLYSQGIEAAGLTGEERVLDCYCGIGTIGLCASKRAAEVIGVESNGAAIRDAVRNARLNKIKNAQFVTSDTGAFLRDFANSGETADVVFLDPARAGCDRLALDSLIRIAPKKIVYISCNPETQARDCGVLAKAGYRIRRVQPVDMFPFTRHVECIALMTLTGEYYGK